jgi:ribosome maturation factor RimP
LFPLRVQVEKTIDKPGLLALLEPTLDHLGYELVDLDVHFGRRGLLRLFIDNEAGVTLADCEFVSGQIGAFLDVEDPLPGSYVLEVSSPGIDRRLRTAAHFQRFRSEEVKIELVRPREGRKRLKGKISGVGADTVAITVDGVEWTIRLDEIGSARLVPRN